MPHYGYKTDIPNGYQQITDLSAAVGLTIPAGSDTAILVAEDQNIRWRDDGTDPTDTAGVLLTIQSPFQYTGDLTKIKFIETTASAKLNVSYYKNR